jgi:hypothetical protein
MSCDVVTVEPVSVTESSKAPIGSAKTFRSYDQGQVLLMPPSLDDWPPKDNSARFVPLRSLPQIMVRTPTCSSLRNPGTQTATRNYEVPSSRTATPRQNQYELASLEQELLRQVGVGAREDVQSI